MISWFRARLRSISRADVLKCLLLLACIAIPIAYLTFLTANPDQNFWFVPVLPVPPYATHVQYYSGSLPGSRTIRFETDQSAEKIRQFYRVELPKLGWYFLCSPTHLEEPRCPLGLSPGMELADAYTRDHEPSQVRAIDINIYKPGGYLANNRHRVVEVTEYRYSPPTPVPTATPGSATARGQVVLGYGDHSPVPDLPLWLGKVSVGQVVDVVDDHLAFQFKVTSDGIIDLGTIEYPLIHPGNDITPTPVTP